MDSGSIVGKQICLPCLNWENVSKWVNTLGVKGPKHPFQFLEMSRVKSPIGQVKEDIQESMSQVSPFIYSLTH